MRAGRIQQSWLTSLVVCFGLVGCGEQASPRKTSFSVTTKRADDRVEVRSDSNQTTLSIHSPFGISNATIKRTHVSWPNVVVLHLHLHGLESLRVASRHVSLNASVSSHSDTSDSDNSHKVKKQDDRPMVRLWTGNKEAIPLDATSPYWMEIRIVGGDSKDDMGIPLRDGFFELRLPSSLFEGNPESIEVHWIDFYRG